jgi:hypothetical protein
MMVRSLSLPGWRYELEIPYGEPAAKTEIVREGAVCDREGARGLQQRLPGAEVVSEEMRV